MILSLILALTSPRDHIPKIASILGIRVGHNGRDRLERRFGVGTYSVAGHPNGREVWLLKSPQSTIDTDGFTYTAHEGELIEGLTWGLDDEARFNHGTAPSSLGWMGKIYLGMPEKPALRLAVQLAGQPKLDKGSYSWTQHGFSKPAVLQQQDPFKTWTATMEIEKGRVSGISISCS